MKKVACRCEMVVEIDASDTIDLDADKNGLIRLSEGCVPSVVCPRCGAIVKTELPLHVISTQRGIDIVVLSELERLSVYRGKPSDSGSGEILLGFQELFERARMLRDDLDSKVVETLKYVLQSKAEESEPEADITVLYNGKVSGALEFHILGLKSGQAGVIKIPEATYTRSAMQIGTIEKTKEPYASIFSGRYQSIKKLGFLESTTVSK